MKRIVWLAGISVALCGGPAFALDIDAGTRGKAIAAVGAAPEVAAPKARAPLPDLQNGVDRDGRMLSGACSVTKADLCYDYRDGRIIYRPSRNWMPEIQGLTPEHISVRRETVLFKYSFK
jgi:hypothetical protein